MVSIGIFLFYFHVVWIKYSDLSTVKWVMFYEGSQFKVTVHPDRESRQHRYEAAAHMEFPIRKQRAVNVHFCLAPFLCFHGPGLQPGHSAITLGCLPDPNKLIRMIPTGVFGGSPPRWLSNLWCWQLSLPLTGMRLRHIGNYVTRLSALRYSYLLTRALLTISFWSLKV